MDSLIASYGSDGEDEAEEDEEQQLPSPPVAGSSLFGSLPPPRFSSQHSLVAATSVSSAGPGLGTGAREVGVSDCALGRPSPSRRSILGALPPPRFPADSTEVGMRAETRVGGFRKSGSELQTVGGRETQAWGGRGDSGLLGRPERTMLPPSRSALPPSSAGDGVDGSASSLGGSEQARLGIFSSLPPPRGESVTSSSLMGSALPRPKDPRRVVEFRPPVNKVLLEASEDEAPPRKKRHATETIPPKHTDGLGLVAILPPPKNTLGAGSALGGGASGQGGRRVALEIAAGVSDGQLVERQNSEAGPLVGKPALSSSRSNTMENTWETQHLNFTGHPMAIAPGQASGTRSQDCGTGSDRFFSEPGHSGLMGDAMGIQYCQTQTANEGSGFSVEQMQNQDTTYGFVHHQPSPLPNASFDAGDPLASIMKYEKKKGREKSAPTFIEVKQDDLTNELVREDKLKSTGIAFGPTYQPVSSSKNKPSKMHRRKHQIGSLYYDMKQKEMELLERRAKGQLTKAETQAKYGW